MSTDILAHLPRSYGPDAPVTPIVGEAHESEHKYSHGPYMVASITLGDTKLTTFVQHKDDVLKLAGELEKIATALRAFEAKQGQAPTCACEQAYTTPEQAALCARAEGARRAETLANLQ